jgi:sugar lactone lactonase YvrE
MTRRVVPAVAVVALLLAGLPAPAGATYHASYTFGTGVGTGDGQFGAGPGAVAEDAAGNVYATDPQNNRVEKFSSTGDFEAKWGSAGAGNGQLSNPRGIDVDRFGVVYVADTGNNRIETFGPQGSFIGIVGGAGELSSPEDVAVDDTDAVFAADTAHNRVAKLDGSGHFVEFGTTPLNHPDGVAVDPGGNVYVGDRDNNRLAKLGPGGALVAPIGGLATPGGVAVDGDGNVLVADRGNDRIEKFTAAGTAFPPSVTGVTAARDVVLGADGDVVAAFATGLEHIDAVAPVTTIDSAPSGLIEDPSADFTFHASIASSTFQCRMAGSGDDFAPCTSPFTATGLAAGLNRFEVRAIDPQGIRERSPASAEFSVDGAQGPPGFDGFDGLPGLDGERGPRGHRGKAGGLIVKMRKPKALRAGATLHVGLDPSVALQRVRVELRLSSSKGVVVAEGARKRLAAGKTTAVRLRVVRSAAAGRLVIVVHARTAGGKAVLVAKRLR